VKVQSKAIVVTLALYGNSGSIGGADQVGGIEIGLGRKDFNPRQAPGAAA